MILPAFVARLALSADLAPYTDAYTGGRRDVSPDGRVRRDQWLSGKLTPDTLAVEDRGQACNVLTCPLIEAIARG